MRNIRFVGTLLAFFMIALSAKGVEVNYTDDGKIAFPEIKGFEILQEYPVYYPDNLWDYINGAADAYLDYQFVDLHIAEYIKEGNSYKAEVYRHKNNVYAFGIYALERSPDYHFIGLGVQGYEESNLIHFIKGPYYIKVTTNADEKESGAILHKIAKSLDNLLEGEVKIPEMFQKFPENGQIPNTEYFVSSNFLGYSFLKNAFSIKYEKSGVKFSIFLIDTNSDEEAGEMQRSLFSKAKSFTEDDPVFEVEDPYNGTILIGLSGKILVGTNDLKDLDLFKKYYKEITK